MLVWSFLIYIVVPVSAEKVLLLALEGLTRSLLERVATPALDSIVAKGSISLLVPEFPSETLPTLASMVTGQHTEMTGILDTEVVDPESGEKVQESNPEFWKNLRNMSTLWTLATRDKSLRVGSVRWPGTHTGNTQDRRLVRWGKTPKYDISEDVSKWNTESQGEEDDGRRRKRFVSSWIKEEETGEEKEEEEKEEEEEEEEEGEEKERRDLSSLESKDMKGRNQTEEIKEENKNDEKNKKGESLQETFNKTTDQEWMMWKDQVETLVTWLGREKDGVDLVLMYVEEPGTQIRSWGPHSTQADMAVRKVDELVALLTETLTKTGIRNQVNLVITGLHGFTEVSTDKVFDISGLVSDTSAIHGHSPVLNIQEDKPEKSLDTYARLQASRDKDNFDLYTRSLVPTSYHYSRSPRVADIILVAKEGYVFTDFWTEAKTLNKAVSRPHSLDNKYGVGGYAPHLDSMHSILLIQGPAIHTQAVADQLTVKVNAVDIFPLICHLLGVPPPPSNGSLSNLRPLLKSSPSQAVEFIKLEVINTIEYYTDKDRLPLTGVLASSTLFLVLLICCCACSIRRRRAALGVAHNYKYSSVKSNRRTEGRVDGSEEKEEEGDKVGLLTSAMMEEYLDQEEPA